LQNSIYKFSSLSFLSFLSRATVEGVIWD